MNASFRHGLMLLWVKEECRNVGSMNCYFLVTFINSLNQSSIKPCLIVHLVAMWTLIYFECVFVGCGVHPVIDAQFRCDVFVFWMDGSCGIQLCFFWGTLWYCVLVDRCMLTVLVCKSSLFCQRRCVAWFRFLCVWCCLWVCRENGGLLNFVDGISTACSMSSSNSFNSSIGLYICIYMLNKYFKC